MFTDPNLLRTLITVGFLLDRSDRSVPCRTGHSASTGQTVRSDRSDRLVPILAVNTDTTPLIADTSSLPMIDWQPFTSQDSTETLEPGPLYLGYDTVQQQGNGILDLGMDLSLMETGCSNGEYQDHHQPESPEYTLQHSISEKFTIRRLFACLGISADRDSSNNTPEHTMVVQPMTNGEAAGGTEPTMMVDNYADGAVWSCPSPTKVVEIGSEDTDLASHEHHYDSDISNTNMEPDIEIIE